MTAFPKGAFAVGFVKIYAGILHLDVAEISQRFREERAKSASGIDKIAHGSQSLVCRDGEATRGSAPASSVVMKSADRAPSGENQIWRAAGLAPSARGQTKDPAIHDGRRNTGAPVTGIVGVVIVAGLAVWTFLALAFSEPDVIDTPRSVPAIAAEPTAEQRSVIDSSPEPQPDSISNMAVQSGAALDGGIGATTKSEATGISEPLGGNGVETGDPQSGGAEPNRTARPDDATLLVGEGATGNDAPTPAIAARADTTTGIEKNDVIVRPMHSLIPSRKPRRADDRHRQKHVNVINTSKEKKGPKTVSVATPAATFPERTALVTAASQHVSPRSAPGEEVSGAPSRWSTNCVPTRDAKQSKS